jgi:hypothetical protein
MKLLFYTLLLQFCNLAIAKNVTTINIAIGHGIHLQEIPNVIAYQSSIPLLFTAPMPHTNFVKVFYEPNLCKHDKWICNTDKDFSSMDMIKSLDKHTMDLQNEILQHIIMQEDHAMTKRALSSDIRDVIGEIGSFCCGLATIKTQTKIYNSNNNARDAIQENHKSLSSQHSHLVELTDNFKNISDKVNNDFSKITSQFNQFNYKLRDSKEISSAATKFSIHAITHLFARYFETTRQTLGQSILADCKNNLLPAAIIPQKSLEHELKSLQTKIKAKGYRLAIPITDVTSYYTKHISECVVQQSTISVTLQVPIIETDTKFTLYNVIAIPQKHEDTTCTLITKPMTLGISNNKKSIIPITDEYKNLCNLNAHSDNLCFLPKRPQMFFTESHCILNMIKNSHIENIMTFCTFTCYPITETIITSMRHNRFAITNPPANLSTRCGNKIEKLDQTHNKDPGTLELRLKCECELLSGNTVLIASDFPCPKDDKLQNAAVHTLPAIWTTLDSYKFDTFSDPFSTFQLTHLNGSYNHDWKAFIPTLNAAPLKPVNALIKDDFQIFSQNSFSWWLVCPTLFIVSALLSLCCILCFQAKIKTACRDKPDQVYEVHNIEKENALSTFHVDSPPL